MSKTNIPERVKIRLWGKAGGRCEYEGCNDRLWLDELTQFEFNAAYMAHIIADSPEGPRGDVVLSEQQKDDISNLMLMCDKHHRLIDKGDVAGHPVDRLRKMKREHEERVDTLTSIQPDRKSHMILFGENIGEHNVVVNWNIAATAMASQGRMPIGNRAIELGLKNNSFEDYEAWQFAGENLRRQFAEQVKPKIASGEGIHFSVFGKAPQPLLMALGSLLTDLNAVEVFQLHKEPQDWVWQNAELNGFNYIAEEPATAHKQVALNLSLSATIDNSRIDAILEGDYSLWKVTIPEPNNDFLKSREQLSMFRVFFRKLLDDIKAKHGQDAVIHVFPAVPVSVAVEIGRVRMPKADLPMRIYDQNWETKGFAFAFDIGEVPSGS